MKVRVAPVYSDNAFSNRRNPFGLEIGKDYECEKRTGQFGVQYRISGQDCWLPAYVFDIASEIPRRKSGETPDEIATWFGYHKSDPVAAMAEEIHMLSNALHDLKNHINGRFGSAQAIVDLSRENHKKNIEHQKNLEALSKAFNMGGK